MPIWVISLLEKLAETAIVTYITSKFNRSKADPVICPQPEKSDETKEKTLTE